MTLKDLSKPLVVACIPAFNEERTIGGVVVRAMKYANYVIVCDDGSSDLTSEIASGLGAELVRHEKNRGYGAALRSLFRDALERGADIIVTLDGDGQHDPREIPKLVGLLKKKEADIVIGSRFLKGGGSEAPSWRKNGIKLISELISNSGLQLSDAQSGFRAYNRKALELLPLTEDGMGISTEILLKANMMDLKVSEVPINVSYDERSSTYNPIIHGLDVVLSTVKHLSIRRPLLFYGLPGLFSIIIAGVFWAMTLSIYTSTQKISTNIVLIALSATLVGLILLNTSAILWVIISVVREKR